MRIRDPGWKKSDTGSGMEKKSDAGWKDKHPRSATLLVTIAPHGFFHKLPYLASSRILRNDLMQNLMHKLRIYVRSRTFEHTAKMDVLGKI